MYSFLLWAFGVILKFSNYALYVLKFISYISIAVFLGFQLKVSKVPDSDELQAFLDLTDSYTLPFLIYAAACEAAHIAIKPLMKLTKYLEKRHFQKLEDQFRNY
ncbi:hypothetical protein J14TS5_28490 [Paenibacillus lautus]|uniref:hypothetical protein n=1 Tax=Paenibacillus lautus TaxID=1401 RepID=UPI001B2F6348|nr:hypothetical protein [Paenibacillus lautus]GIO97763.1 hypothetical protein J14TS5_28490 [Paenibacillus lautus]